MNLKVRAETGSRNSPRWSRVPLEASKKWNEEDGNSKSRGGGRFWDGEIEEKKGKRMVEKEKEF